MSMIEEKTWKQFQEAGLLWWINRGLHIFGWALVFEQKTDGTIERVYPARTKFRGFAKENEEEGFKRLSQYMVEHADDLLSEADG